jgi:predicted deacetylase
MLLVAIHDVTPAYADEVRRLWSLCRARGVIPALFVVPDWHGRWPLTRHPSFVGWLRDCAAEGADIVLHGYRHDEVGSPRRWRDELRAWGRTRREGEFLTLDGPAAETRIRQGVQVLRRIGLAPVGFVPPAWLASESADAAAATLGLGFSEDANEVKLLPGRVRIPAPVVRWSARSTPRALGSVIVAEARWRFGGRACARRIGFHPPDVRHWATAASLEAALDRWLGVHPPLRYAALSAATPDVRA